MISRTRVKYCGMTRKEDALAACKLGVDAIGFVFYRPSHRYLDPQKASDIASSLPPWVTVVALVANESSAIIRELIEMLPAASLQFHGDEDEKFCLQFSRPYIKAISMKANVDVSQIYATHLKAHGFIVDAWVEGLGGKGKSFDWNLVRDTAHLRPTIVAGGLHEDNVAEVIETLNPWGVDVASGIESAPGIKDVKKMTAFMEAVYKADERK